MIQKFGPKNLDPKFQNIILILMMEYNWLLWKITITPVTWQPNIYWENVDILNSI